MRVAALGLLVFTLWHGCGGHHHRVLPPVVPCPDHDSASPHGEGSHHHDPCDDGDDD